MKKGFEKIVAWQYDGRTAVGVLYGSYNYVSVAVNYFMDSNIREGDLWFMDDIHKDDNTELRLATEEEIQTLINALHDWDIPHKYDKATMTLRNYDAYPTVFMKVMQWIEDKLNI